MKKGIIILLIAILLISTCACNSEEPSKVMTPKEAVIDKVEWQVSFQLYNSGCKAPDAKVTTIQEINENEFVFFGTYSGLDVYNQRVYGTFEGTGKYNPETDKASVDYEID